LTDMFTPGISVVKVEHKASISHNTSQQ